MLIIGVVLLLVGYLVGIPLLVTLGIIFAVLGALLLVLDVAGHPVGGRRWW